MVVVIAGTSAVAVTGAVVTVIAGTSVAVVAGAAVVDVFAVAGLPQLVWPRKSASPRKCKQLAGKRPGLVDCLC